MDSKEGDDMYSSPKRQIVTSNKTWHNRCYAPIRPNKRRVNHNSPKTTSLRKEFQNDGGVLESLNDYTKLAGMCRSNILEEKKKEGNLNKPDFTKMLSNPKSKEKINYYTVFHNVINGESHREEVHESLTFVEDEITSNLKKMKTDAGDDADSMISIIHQSQEERDRKDDIYIYYTGIGSDPTKRRISEFEFRNIIHQNMDRFMEKFPKEHHPLSCEINFLLEWTGARKHNLL